MSTNPPIRIILCDDDADELIFFQLALTMVTQYGNRLTKKQIALFFIPTSGTPELPCQKYIFVYHLMPMFYHFKNKHPQLNAIWNKYLPFQRKMDIPAKTILLEEGKRSRHYIYVEKGCLRAFFNNDGTDKTIQFFFEQEGLTAFDSFINNVPSEFNVETIEPSVVCLLPKKYVLQLLDELCREQKTAQMLLGMSAQRQVYYMQEFVSFIRDTAEQRYQRLVTSRPHIVRRVPQHYIASYLGVSTVHLSRIKNKLSKGRSHF